MGYSPEVLDASVIGNFGIKAVYEIRRVIEFKIHQEDLRLEIWYHHSNLSCQWVARMYTRHDSKKTWTPWQDFPWVEERDEQTAIFTALAFVEEQLA